MPHHHRAREQRDNARKVEQLAEEVRGVAGQQDEAGLFEGGFCEGFVDAQDVAEAETEDEADCEAEDEEVEEAADQEHGVGGAELSIGGYLRP